VTNDGRERDGHPSILSDEAQRSQGSAITVRRGAAPPPGTTTHGSMPTVGDPSTTVGPVGTTADLPSDTTTDGSTSTSGSVDTADDTGPEPYPEECHEPEALIDVMSAITPDGPLTIDEAWLGVDACSKYPYVALVQYPSPGTGPEVEITLRLQPEAFLPEEYFGVYPLSLGFSSEPIGTIDVLEPMDGVDLGTPDGSRHLHGRIDVHETGWDLSVEVDLLDCGVWECFCPCR
jgi:hypothetical protein